MAAGVNEFRGRDPERSSDEPGQPERGAGRTHGGRDRPGRPRQADVEWIDATVNEQVARDPELKAERAALRAKMRESDVFGNMTLDEARLTAREKRPESWTDIPYSPGELRLLEQRRRQHPEQDGRHDERDHDGSPGHADTDLAAPEDPRAGQPEIVGMHLREGFDATAAEWLNDFRSARMDLPQPPATRTGIAQKPDAPSLGDQIAGSVPDAPQHAEDLPEGADLVRMDDPDKSRLERLGNRFYRADFQEDLTGTVGELGKEVEGVFRRPPTGIHIVICEPVNVVMKPPDPYHGIDGGSALTAVLAASLVAGEAIKYGHSKWTDLKEKRRHAGDG